jgi:hypothetical protein
MHSQDAKARNNPLGFVASLHFGGDTSHHQEES